MTPRAKSRSVLKSKLAALEMRAHPKNAGIEEILDGIPRGEQNRNPTEKHYSIPCPYFGLGNCTTTLCVAKKWWDLRPLNSDRISYKIYVYCSNHCKGLYYTKKVPHLVLKMADNHLRHLYSRHILKHGVNHYPYLDYDENNRRSDWIKVDASVRRLRHARKLTEINSETKARRDVVNKAEHDMRVWCARF